MVEIARFGPFISNKEKEEYDEDECGGADIPEAIPVLGEAEW